MKKTIFTIIILIMISSCSTKKLDVITIRINDTEFEVEIAKERDDMERGLMHRKSMPEKEGMLFVYSIEVDLSFWMKNTFIPLSVAYISSAGVIKEIHDMEPESLKSVKSGSKSRYALELNQGTFEKFGINPGDKIIFPDGFRMKY